MPGPSMSGAELGGRLIALEATVMALAGEATAAMPEEKAMAVFAGIKQITHDLIDQLAPEFSPASPLVKQMAEHADGYADQWAGVIQKVRAKILKDGVISRSYDRPSGEQK